MFGEMIYKRRKALRLTQKALAEKCGIGGEIADRLG